MSKVSRFTKRIGLEPNPGESFNDVVERVMDAANRFVRARQEQEKANGRAWYLVEYTVKVGGADSTGGFLDGDFIDATVTFTNNPAYKPPGRITKG